MTRNLAKILGAVAFVGTMAVGTAAPTMAQGFYFGVPGAGVEIGPRHHHRYYYDEGRPYHRYYSPHRYYYDDR
jgi:hypothetical protein